MGLQPSKPPLGQGTSTLPSPGLCVRRSDPSLQTYEHRDDSQLGRALSQTFCNGLPGREPPDSGALLYVYRDGTPLRDANSEDEDEDDGQKRYLYGTKSISPRVKAPCGSPKMRRMKRSSSFGAAVAYTKSAHADNRLHQSSSFDMGRDGGLVMRSHNHHHHSHDQDEKA